MDGFLAFHGVGEHVVGHTTVAGSDSVECIETCRNSDRSTDIGS